MREYQVRICERLGVQFPGPTRQLDASHGKHGEAPDQKQGVAQRLRDRRADYRLQQSRVGREPRQDIPRAVDLKIGRAQRDDPVEHGAAYVGDDALSDPGDEVEAAERRTGEQDDDADKEKNSAVERRYVAALEPSSTSRRNP